MSADVDAARAALLEWLPARCSMRGATHTHNGPCPEEAHDRLAAFIAAVRAEQAHWEREWLTALQRCRGELADAEAKLAALQEALLDIEGWTWGEPTMSGERYPNMLNRERIHKRARAALDALAATPAEEERT